MVVERKSDSCNKVYYEFNGSSHLYFINGIVNDGTIDLYIGSKILETKLDLLFKIIFFCLNNFKIVTLVTRYKDYIFFAKTYGKKCNK